MKLKVALVFALVQTIQARDGQVRRGGRCGEMFSISREDGGEDVGRLCRWSVQGCFYKNEDRELSRRVPRIDRFRKTPTKA